ncbi:MAG: NAD(P)-dependent oxidoreductase [Lachnospiraceae bacterium]|nr:NAD(P)-dependent oxidoreductase [Lachnospiraceae bacterium]
MSKILVTGAAGFIGIYVTRHLLAQGYDVIALINSKKLDAQSDRLTVVEADICDEGLAKKVSGVIGQCQTVVHLAADIRVPGDGRTIDVNCLGTYHVTELANELGASKLIYLSSVPVIGKPVDVPITEEHPLHPKTLYHITKLAGEGIVNQVGALGMKKLMLRIPSPVGRGMRQNVFLYRMLEQCRKGQDILLYGAGGRVQNYVDVRDIAEAVSLSETRDAEGVFLIGGESISNLQLAEKCIACTNAGVQIKFAGVEDAAETECWELSGEKARTVLGYVPGHTLDDTIGWIYSEL